MTYTSITIHNKYGLMNIFEYRQKNKIESIKFKYQQNIIACYFGSRFLGNFDADNLL